MGSAEPQKLPATSFLCERHGTRCDYNPRNGSLFAPCKCTKEQFTEQIEKIRGVADLGRRPPDKRETAGSSPASPTNSEQGKSGRADEGAGPENRKAREGLVGSNPTSSSNGIYTHELPTSTASDDQIAERSQGNSDPIYPRATDEQGKSEPEAPQSHAEALGGSNGASRESARVHSADSRREESSTTGPKQRPADGTVGPTRYEIFDGDTLLAVHMREDRPEGKKVWWELPDGTKGLAGFPIADLPLFGMRDLAVDAPDIVICEGEKAAAALQSRGIAALGTVTGASSCPSASVFKPLKGRNAVLWPDNDAVGRKHMEKVAKVLGEVGATVFWLEWSGAPEHGDAADYDGPTQEIYDLISAALTRPPLLPAVAEQHLPAENLDELYADRQATDAYEVYQVMRGDVRDYSWDGLIRDGCTAVLSGLMSSGKSTLAMNLVRGWALGTELFGRRCRQGKTLVVVSPKEYEAWADTIGFWGLRGLVYLVESTKAHFGEPGEVVKWFEYTMLKWACRTFVLDTLFDFFGMPPNRAGDANRIAMNEQTPLLELVHAKNYSGLVSGHAPKSEAKAIDPRDPEEAFGGHSAWTAQHRMRMAVRRKTLGVNAFITGKGGYGDTGILKEQMLIFDEANRLDSLGGPFAEYLAQAAMPSVIDALRELGEPTSITKIVEAMGKGEKWVKAGLKNGRKEGVIEMFGGQGKRGTKYGLTEWPRERELL